MRVASSGRKSWIYLDHHGRRQRRIVELGCRQQIITSDQLWQELADVGELADLESDAVSVKALEHVAMA